MIKLKIYIQGILLFSLISCKQHLPDKIKNQLDKTENFWKQRNYLIKTEKMNIEYPQKTDSTNTERRVNRMYIDNMSCQFEIFVDDVVLLKIMGPITKNGGGVTGAYDINQLLLTSGKHEVKVRMYPQFNKLVFGDEGYVNLKFYYFLQEKFKNHIYNNDMNAHNGIHIDQKDKQWIEKWDQESQTGYEGDYVAKQPDRFKGLPAYEWRRNFNAEVPFNLDGWRNSVNLKKEQEEEKKDIQNEVFSEYKKIHELFEKRDAAAYSALVREREDLITQTLYYRDSDKKLRIEEIIKLINDTNYEIEPMFKETFRLDFQGYGKLVAIVNMTDGEGIIRLKNKNNPDDNIYLDFRFQRKHKGDKLTVI